MKVIRKSLLVLLAVFVLLVSAIVGFTQTAYAETDESQIDSQQVFSSFSIESN
ncbi:MAG: hypothetical protein NC132_02530 [Corallococcus sp.]|nr:hypothetical protein [Corallococcus sp.]MCM1358984.1 hypothetical protein [Corallococcus sp.]MCM1394973.1 hypothetical protein [Corallococcus sp.]